MSKKSAARSGFADEIGARRNHGTYQILPSAIRVDHRNNVNRAQLYSLAAELPELADHPAFCGVDKFSFSRQQVLDRVASFYRKGQETRIKVEQTKTGLAFVARGYLRHVAGLWIEVVDQRATEVAVPGGGRLKDGIGVDVVTGENQIEAAWGNIAENEAVLPSPIDEAKAAERLLFLEIDKIEVCDRLGLAKRSAKKKAKENAVNRALALLKLPIADQLDVHEGRMTPGQARAKGSGEGRGGATGRQKGVRPKKLRARLESEDKRPRKGLPANDVEALLAVLAGNKKISDLEGPARDWAEFITKE